MKVLFLSVTKKIIYVLSACVFLAALIVLATYLSSPFLAKYKDTFEEKVSYYFQQPVKIEKVALSWQYFQPAVSLDNVTVLNKETNTPELKIKKVQIGFSILHSLWQRTLVPSTIVLSGSELNIYYDSNKEIHVQGLPMLSGAQDEPFTAEAKLKELLSWLAAQPRLVLENIDVHYTSLKGNKFFVTLYKLNIQNMRGHSIFGKAILHQGVPTELTVATDWQGDPTDLAKIRAKLYLYISGLKLSQWMQDLNWQGWEIQNGLVSAKCWTTWDNNTFQKIQTTFQFFGLDLYSATDKSHHKMNRFSGNVGWKRTDKEIIIAGDEILIDLPHHLWPSTSFYLTLAPNNQQQWLPTMMTWGYLDLKDVQSFLIASPPFLSDGIHQQLNKLKLTGALQNGVVKFTGEPGDVNAIEFSLGFNQISFLPIESYPGLKNFSGTIKWGKEAGTLNLKTQKAQLTYDKIFAQPLPVEELNADIDIKHETNNAWLATIRSAQLLNSDLVANALGTITISPEGAASTDLKADFSLQKANHVTRYLPQKIFDKDLNDWLSHAFLSGEVREGHAELKGNLADFPFDNKAGIFSIQGKVKNIDLRFAPSWPVLQQVNGNINFLGRSLAIKVDQANMMGLPVKGATGEIASLGGEKPPVLNVTVSPMDTDFPQALQIVKASPLDKILGKLFKVLEGKGRINLQLGLTIPLKDPDNTQVKGHVLLKNNDLIFPDWNLEIRSIKGELDFTEDSVKSQEMSGILFNKPFTVSLSSEKQNNTVVIHPKFKAQVSVEDIENWLKLPLADYAKGLTQIEGLLDITNNAPVAIHLNSKLKGIALALPTPYGKKAEAEKAISADIVAQDDQPLRIKGQYGDNLGAALVLERKAEKFNLISLAIQVGSGIPDWPTQPGLYVIGNFDTLDWDQIKDYLDQAGGDIHSGSLQLKAIDVKAKTLKLGGVLFSNVGVQVTPTATQWLIDINSPDITGKLQVPKNMNRQGMINGQFQKVTLQSAIGNTSKGPFIEVGSLPAISLTANSVTYNGMPLGQFTFRASPSGGGLGIQTLSIQSSRLNLQASGDWTRSGTRLRGSANSSSVSELLNSFGFDASNFVAKKGNLTFDLNWDGPPFAPSLGNLGGKASLNVGPGRIVDIGESGAKMSLGRMLSIFSLQTIPRRLSLDFSDVFQQGYSFDFIKGDFTFQNGSANTSNLNFNGPVAQVGINGRIGIENKDYNFTLSVTPYVTSSIPVAAAIINPYIGLAALAVNTVIGPQVSKATTYYYAVTGSWNNPVWKPISRGER